MPLVDAGRNAMLTGGLGNVITHVSLHNGDPSTTGANELTGGSPAYARKAVTWGTAASGLRANITTALDFDIPAGTTVFHFGFWSAITTGTFYGYFPVGGFAVEAATFAASTDVFTSYAHGYVNTDRVLVYDVHTAGVPTGYTEGTVYFVVAAATDTFQLSATSGGAAVNGTTDGEVAVQKCLPEVFAAQGVYSMAIGAVVLNAQLV
jgi:hypothetical protein